MGKSYSWILAVTLAYSPLKSTSPMITFNRQNGCGTCQFHLRVTQLGPPLVASLRRSVVNHSVASYVIRNARKSIARHSWNFLSHANFCRARQVTRGGRAQVVGWSVIGRKALQVSRRSVASVSRRSGRDCDSGAESMPIDSRIACEGRELASLSWWDHKSLLLLGQLCTFLFPRMSVAPQHWCKR